MNRVLKFRAWDTVEKKWLFGYEYPNLGGFNLTGEVVLCGELNTVSLLKWNDISIMQFTGLTDKNGKEIYEGDILNVCNGSINGVQWMQEPYAVEYKMNKGYIMPMFCWNEKGENDMDSTHWCEVIGNIQEDPELLS